MSVFNYLAISQGGYIVNLSIKWHFLSYFWENLNFWQISEQTSTDQCKKVLLANIVIIRAEKTVSCEELVRTEELKTLKNPWVANPRVTKPWVTRTPCSLKSKKRSKILFHYIHVSFQSSLVVVSTASTSDPPTLFGTKKWRKGCQYAKLHWFCIVYSNLILGWKLTWKYSVSVVWHCKRFVL